MISKKKALIWGLLLVILSSLLTFSLTNAKYAELNEFYQKYSKAIYLENLIKENYLGDVDENKLFEGQLKGMFQSLEDPYSVYMTKDEFNDLIEHTKGVYGGIGVIVTPGEDNLITVVAPIEDTPGAKSGIKTGDKIVKVNGKEFTADKMDDAVKIMKGEPGTDVVLTILRKDEEGNSEFFDLTIKREEIRLKSVKSTMLSNKIGYIRIISFDELTYDDFKKHLTNLQEQGMKGLIIDLRNNPGGILDVCTKIADELMGEGTIVYTEDKYGHKEYIKSDKEKIDVLLVLLVNEGSASASEILSGAIKDSGRGILIGTKTFGKGIVQRIKPLKDGSGIKLTVSQYFTPSGKNIHGVGIEPNIEVKLPDNVEMFGVDNISQDTQLKKAIEVISQQIK